jgi:hypothetical protein
VTLQARLEALAAAIRNKINAMMPRLQPQGGTQGQALVKTTADDYASAWTTLTKTSVGLANVDNVSDADKPISTLTQNALNGKLATSHAGSGGSAHANAVAGGLAGFMTGADKSKLDQLGQSATITFVIDAGTSAITTGPKGMLQIPFPCTITGWTLLADQAGSCVLDIWKTNFAAAPPQLANSITGSAKPTLSNTQTASSSGVASWATAIAADDVLRFNIDSAATITRLTLSLKVTRTG